MWFHECQSSNIKSMSNNLIPPLYILRSSVFVYPTETCYGLGCDATNRTLVNRVYAIKGRSFTKPVSWIVADIKMAKRYVEFRDTACDLADKFWPGGLTLVLPLREECKHLAAFVRSEWVGLRVSSHPVARAISRRLDLPIVATSANVSWEGECYSVSEAERQFSHQKEKPDISIDCGELARVPPTTVVKIIGADVELIRQGAIKLE